MNIKNKIAITTLIGYTLITSGCATITQGSDQSIHFDTDPTGATCSITREGEGTLYSDFKTPQSLDIEKDQDELVITCTKDGYEKTVIHADSNFEGWALGNLLLGGPIGVGVDAASGALSEYPSQIMIPLKKQ